MNQEVSISIFKFQESSIRVTPDGSGEPWFVANDVCEALELASPRKALSRLDGDEKGVTIEHTPGGDQAMNTVSEAGLYALTFKSRKPKARQFRRWVTHEVIPAIRKCGYYYNYQAAGADGAAGLVLGLAKHLVTLEQRIDKLETVTSSGEVTRRQVNVLPPVKEISTRLKISQLIRGYAERTRTPYKEIWDNLYYEFKYRYHVNLWQRVQNSQKKHYGGLDAAEDQGCLEDLYTLAKVLFVETN